MMCSLPSLTGLIGTAGHHFHGPIELHDAELHNKRVLILMANAHPHMVWINFPIEYDAGGIHAVVQRGPDPWTIVKGLVHNGLVRNSVYEEWKVWTESYGSHEVGAHLEGALRICSCVEEGKVHALHWNGSRATSYLAQLVLRRRDQQ